MADMTEPLAAAPVRPLHLRLLPAFIGDTGHSRRGYILKGWLLTLLPSLALAAVVGMIFSAFFGKPQAPEFGEPGPVLVFLMVLFAPVVETLIMVPPLLILNRLFGPSPAAALSAIGWAIAHSLQAPIWGFVIWWPFFVFSTIILVWRKKSLVTGMLIVMAIHGMQNAVPALVLLAGRGSGGG
jgi:membrane protease YdiL (CAAX protease family)